MNKKATDIVGYLGVVGWLIAFFAGTRKESKFHLSQAFTCAVFTFGTSLLSGVFHRVAIIGTLLGFANIFVWILSIIGLINAMEGTIKPVPFIGNIQLLDDKYFTEDINGHRDYSTTTKAEETKYQNTEVTTSDPFDASKK